MNALCKNNGVSDDIDIDLGVFFAMSPAPQSSENRDKSDGGNRYNRDAQSREQNR